jgi:hypothetical protein
VPQIGLCCIFRRAGCVVWFAPFNVLSREAPAARLGLLPIEGPRSLLICLNARTRRLHHLNNVIAEQPKEGCYDVDRSPGRRTRPGLLCIRSIAQVVFMPRVPRKNQDGEMRTLSFCLRKEAENYSMAHAAADPKTKATYEAVAREYAHHAMLLKEKKQP